MLARIGAIKYGRFDPGAATAYDSVRRTKIPILLIHGEDDGFVPVEMSRRLADASDLVRLHTFPGAHHALSFITDMERYERILYEFIEQVTATG